MLEYQVDEMHTYRPYNVMRIALQNVEGVCTVMLAIVPFTLHSYIPKLKRAIM